MAKAVNSAWREDCFHFCKRPNSYTAIRGLPEATAVISASTNIR